MNQATETETTREIAALAAELERVGTWKRSANAKRNAASNLWETAAVFIRQGRDG